MIPTLPEQIREMDRLDEIIADPSLPTKPLPDGTVIVGTRPTWIKRAMQSGVVKLQAATGVVCVIWLAVPQDVVMAVVPAEYAAKGLLVYTVATAVVRLRNV